MAHDRVQLATSMIARVEDRFPIPSHSQTQNPIRLIKEAEQQVSAMRCKICGSRNQLEQHHVAGRANYPDTITLCRRCHDELSHVYQLKWLPWASQLASYLLGWSDVFHLVWQKTRDAYFFELSKIFAQNARYVK